MLNEDCYRLLQISPDADEKIIRKAYRERSKELHPDVNPRPDAASQFAKLAAAAETLLDPIQRLKHDDRFGYNKQIRNQDANAKQQFSEYQKEKAQNLVKDWSEDYTKAMEMRERQRMEAIRSVRRRMFVTIISILALLATIAAMFMFLSLDDLPDQK